MLTTIALFALSAVSAVIGAPIPRSTPTVNEVLNFALTLEYLENTFYAQGLAQYTEQDFVDDGLPSWAYGRFVQISQHEATHVKFLTAALGNDAVKPCEYDFPYDSPKTFAAMSMVFETVGSSAYLGGAKFLTENTDYLTAAGSILAVEARQASWVTSSIMKLQPWNGPFDVPLTTSGAYSLAAPFIKSCPSTNPAIPVKPFPALTLSASAPVPNATVAVSYTPTNAPYTGGAYVAWLDGLDVVFSAVGSGGKTVVPAGLRGTVYAVLVKEKETPSDDNLLSGFTVVQFPFHSDAREGA
ncbi:ferritin-like domain-containing protein [Trametes elegans]|nr:ferritin-like domain-containing protein [Trametes elegans]